MLNSYRNELGAAVTATVGLAAAGWIYGRHIEPNWIEVVRHELPIADLPSHLDGFKIVQMSDFHLWPHTKVAQVRKAVHKVQALRPNVVALTGDYVSLNAQAIYALGPELAKLSPSHGMYAVLGNHDVDRRFPETKGIIKDGLASVKIPLLVNERVELDNGLVIAGLDEMFDGMPNLPKAMDGVSAETPTILLMHQPDYADHACRDPRIKVQLSGHTHGGQVCPPFIKPLYLPYYGTRYYTGLHKVGNLWLNVNRGIGLAYFGPVRFRCRPEITEIVLRRG